MFDFEKLRVVVQADSVMHSAAAAVVKEEKNNDCLLCRLISLNALVVLDENNANDFGDDVSSNDQLFNTILLLRWTRMDYSSE
jgi:hypothetical protein